MKPFLFRLESVLLLRTREEDRAREACASAAAKQATAALALSESQGQLDACHTALSIHRCGTTNRTEQILLLSALQNQQSHCELLVSRCAAADREVAARREELLAARRKREALTNLKERQRGAHRLGQDRQDEAAIADIISARHILTMREAQP